MGTLNFGLIWPDWLNFGREVAFDHELTIDVTLSPPDGLIRFYFPSRIEAVCSARWGTSQEQVQERSIQFVETRSCENAISIPSKPGRICDHHDQCPWIDGQLVFGISRIAWHDGLIKTNAEGIPWNAGNPQSSHSAFLWTTASPERSEPAISWNTATKELCESGWSWHTATPHRIDVYCPWDTAYLLCLDVPIGWQQARSPPRRWRRRNYVRSRSNKHEGRLNFGCPRPRWLNFGLTCFGSALLYPKIRRSYRVINTAALLRVADSADIPCSAISVSLDWVSWCWSLSATLIGRAAHDLVPAYPGKVRATLNGFSWDFVVDDLRYNRKFNEFSATISGRSPAAVMATPYAATRSYKETNLATAQQLAANELFSEWQLDWDETLIDWTVPEGTYEYQNFTPIESIIRIVKSTGGRVYADATEDILHAIPKWPVTPWDWSNAVPDQSLPSSYTLTEQRNVATGSEYDCMVVSGGKDNGVCVLATREGMPGTYPANAIVDSLITDISPATARAKQEIADQWPMKHYTLSLPLQATPAGAGLLLPGTIFDFVDGDDGWRGLVIGVKLIAGRNSIMQDLEVIVP